MNKYYSSGVYLSLGFISSTITHPAARLVITSWICSVDVGYAPYRRSRFWPSGVGSKIRKQNVADSELRYFGSPNIDKDLIG
ncbi:hypothetical protein EAI_17443 [Harpegnathos saltator]|uniref:Uncharacterized protein n=1 Tax=Harpegnathos saltator TaxID=610380 RepID=E2C093_HARSA|nr:hypothetical protein EAI_17443 [Harpegnathos saltator]